MPPSEVWIMIDGHFENVKVQWEMTRVIAFNVAAYGNSDPKKFPKSAAKWMPFEWDRKTQATNSNSILEQNERMRARRHELMKKHGHPIL